MEQNSTRQPLLSATQLKKYFNTSEGTVRAVDGVNFDVYPGETLGLVGESGSGKTTTAYMVAGIHEPSGGRITFNGQDITGTRRSLQLKREIQIVFQDPGSSLNPLHSIKDILTLPLRVHRIVDKRQYNDKVAELLDRVHLPKSYLYKRPRELSEGEKQAVAIARAIAVNPRLIVLDEPTSSLDVSMQAWILRLLQELQDDFGFSYLLITHDLSLMRNFATRVAIMYLGEICEVASSDSFFLKPKHPYTQMLISSIPVVTEDEEKLKPAQIVASGEIPSPVSPPSGCRFHTRCSLRMPVCDRAAPTMGEIEPGHVTACHLYTSEQDQQEAANV